jgi:hypothetical protein
MATLALIKEAIIALKDRTGSSTSAINKYLLGEKQVRRIAVPIVSIVLIGRTRCEIIFFCKNTPHRQNYEFHNFVIIHPWNVFSIVNDTSSS